MSLESVSRDLNQRIIDGKAWFESEQALELSGLELRGLPCTAKLVGLLETPARVERFGLAFHVSVKSSKGLRTFQINVRIKPDRTEGKATASYPYIVVYLVVGSKAVEEDIFHIDWSDETQYEPWANAGVQDWYRTWIARALATNSGKFFAAETRAD